MRAPSGWLTDNTDLLPMRGRALDVACGDGRHTLWLAAAGFAVRAVDRDATKVAQLQQRAGTAAIDAVVLDLETDPPPGLGVAAYEVVLVVNYLHRALMPAIREAVAPGGLLIYQTFTTRQAERGRPANPAFLLKDGELAELVAPLTILRAREGEFNGAFVSSVVALRPLPA